MKSTPKAPSVFGLDYFVSEIPGEINPELIHSTVDMGQFVRWALLYTYGKAIDLLTNYAQTIQEKAHPFNVTIWALAVVLSPLHDEEFKKRIETIEQHFSDMYDSQIAKWNDPAYGLDILQEVINLLDRKDLLSLRTGITYVTADLESIIGGSDNESGSE